MVNGDLAVWISVGLVVALLVLLILLLTVKASKPSDVEILIVPLPRRRYHKTGYLMDRYPRIARPKQGWGSG